MAHYPTAGQRLEFQAVLENWAEGMDYCAVRVPATITLALGTKGPVLVLAQLNDSVPFQVSLFPVGGGQHFVRIKAKVRKEAKVAEGDRVRVRISVLDRGAVTIPEDLMRALRADRVQQDFTALPPGKRNFIIRRINDAARLETRVKRIHEAVATLRASRNARIGSRE